jgi:hypothetical protein
MTHPADQPTISTPIRIAFALAIPVLLGGAGLLFATEVVRAQWVWTLAPYHARFLGSIYTAQAVGAILLAIMARRSLARMSFMMSLPFTALVTLFTLVNISQFDLAKTRVIVWLVLYIVFTLLLAWVVWDARADFDLGDKPSGFWRTMPLALAAILGLYSLGLMILPAAFSAFWPWGVDAFHGQMYSSIFLGSAVGAYLIARGSSPLMLLILGLVFAIFGLGAIGGLVYTDSLLHRVDWSQAGVWLWIGGFAVLYALPGVAFLIRSRKGTS